MQFDVPPDLKIPADIRKLAERVEHPEDGFFGPQSVYWKVARENALMLGGAAAALLQMAHPGVAAGVAEHSSLLSDPIARFNRTFSVVYRIVFGTVDEASEAAAYARHLHTGVKGTVPETIGDMKHGQQYHANQGDLLLWVYATLVQQSVRTYETFVEPLTWSEKQQYYQESKVFGQLFGIQPDEFPETWEDFNDYFDRVVESALGMGRYGRLLRNQMFGGLPQYWVMIPLGLIMAGANLPDRTRRQFGLPWGGAMPVIYSGFVRAVQQLLPFVPDSLRYQRYYLRARTKRRSGRAA